MTPEQVDSLFLYLEFFRQAVAFCAGLLLAGIFAISFKR